MTLATQPTSTLNDWTAAVTECRAVVWLQQPRHWPPLWPCLYRAGGDGRWTDQLHHADHSHHRRWWPRTDLLTQRHLHAVHTGRGAYIWKTFRMNDDQTLYFRYHRENRPHVNELSLGEGRARSRGWGGGGAWNFKALWGGLRISDSDPGWGC